MRSETIASKLSPQNNLKERSGGNAFDAITSGDLYAVISACDATPLIFSYYAARFGLGKARTKHVKHIEVEKQKRVLDDKKITVDVHVTKYKKEIIDTALNEFASNLSTWIYSAYLNWSNETDEDGKPDMPKRIKLAATASDEISMGLARYLSDNPQDDEKISPYFKPIKPDTFRRKYKAFAHHAKNRLLPKLVELEKQIHEYTKKEQ